MCLDPTQLSSRLIVTPFCDTHDLFLECACKGEKQQDFFEEDDLSTWTHAGAAKLPTSALLAGEDFFTFHSRIQL